MRRFAIVRAILILFLCLGAREVYTTYPAILGCRARVAAAETAAGPPKEVGSDEMFTERMLVVKGEGLAPDRALSKGQMRLMASEAAKVVALRNLARVLSGVRVSGDTTVENLQLQNSQIRATVEGMIRGAHVVYESYNPDEASAAVYMQVALDGPNGISSTLVPQLARRGPDDLPAAPAYKPSTAPPPAEPADGLIIDATGSGLRPALVNRILTTNGSALFEPSKIAPDILAKRGCGEYTNDVGKAKAILVERGAKNPLIVKVSTVQRSTDAQVSEADATAIFAANQKTNFLEGAKVVFVL